MKELVEKAMLDKTNWPLGQKNEEPINHKEKTLTHEKEIIQWLHAYNLDLKEEDIFEILRMKRRWYPKYNMLNPDAVAHGVRIMNQVGLLDMVDIYTQYIDGVYLDFDKWKKYHDLGFTTLIPNVLDTHKQVRDIDNYLNKELGICACANFYFGKPGRRASFNKHRHDYDVIVKQIYGTTTWIVKEQEITMEPQSVLFIPKKTYHEVVSKNTPKLSLTINLE